MATSHISTSKNPSIGAKNFFPLDTNIILIVPMDTSNILEIKMRAGKTTQLNTSLSIIGSMFMNPPPPFILQPSMSYYLSFPTEISNKAVTFFIQFAIHFFNLLCNSFLPNIFLNMELNENNVPETPVVNAFTR